MDMKEDISTVKTHKSHSFNRIHIDVCDNAIAQCDVKNNFPSMTNTDVYYIPKYILFFAMYKYGPVRKCDILIIACYDVCFQVRPRDAYVIAKQPFVDSSPLHNNHDYTIDVASMFDRNISMCG
jgi:hypothetical protein